MPVAILAGVWAVFLARGLSDILLPPLAAAVMVYLLIPYRGQAWASRTMAVAVVLALLWIMSKVQSIVWIAGLGLFTAYLLNPPVTWLERRGLSRGLASLLMLLPALGLIVLSGYLLLPRLYQQATALLVDLPVYVRDLVERYGARLQDAHLEELPLDLPALVNRLTASVETALGGAGQGLLKVAQRTGVVLSVLILTPVVGFNLLKDFPAFYRNTLSLLPRDIEAEVADVMGEMDQLIGRYLRGQITVAAIVGTLTGIGLTIAGLPYSVLLGVFTGLMNVVPIVGFWISLVLSLVVALSTATPGAKALAVAATYAVVQLIEQNFVSPRIVGRETGLHPAAVLLSLLVLTSLGGLAGAVLAIPAVLFFRLFFVRYVARRLRETTVLSRPDAG